MPFSRFGCVAVADGRQAVAHQRAGFTVGPDQRRHAADLVQQVPDLAEIAHAVLAQRGEHVRGAQACPGQFAILYLAADGQDLGRVIDEAGNLAVPPGERDQAVRDQEDDHRDRGGGHSLPRWEYAISRLDDVNVPRNGKLAA